MTALMVLFARIGWMKFYAGPIAGDEKPIGGGGYNETNVGLELFNFKPLAGHLYGYVEANEGINLGRIQRSCKNSQLDGVLVIFFSKQKERPGQVIVGWYSNASVFRKPQEDQNDRRQGKSYNIVAKATEAVLLPVDKRRHEIPRGKGSTGQSNVTYPLTPKGEPRDDDWISEAIDYIQSYEGENLLINPTANLLLARASGYQSNKDIQLAVESRAMNAAKSFYKNLGYDVEDVSEKRSWDLECTKPGSYLRVEVKGLRDAGARVILTGNEVAEASKPNASMELFVVHSIRIEDSENPIGSGGIGRRYENWNPQSHNLSPTQYLCELTQGLGSTITLVD
jgi:Domain of unknown function (DUF3883)